MTDRKVQKSFVFFKIWLDDTTKELPSLLTMLIGGRPSVSVTKSVDHSNPILLLPLACTTLAKIAAATNCAMVHNISLSCPSVTKSPVREEELILSTLGAHIFVFTSPAAVA